MERFEIIALCERWGVAKEDQRGFVQFIRDARLTKRLGRRILGRYKPVLAEIYAIMSRKAA